MWFYTLKIRYLSLNEYEVDFIVQEQAFEVKLSNSVNKSHFKGLIEFNKDHNFKLNIICLEPKKRVTIIDGKEITIWPVQEFLETLWSNEIGINRR